MNNSNGLGGFLGSNSLTLKIMFIGFLVLVLLIPMTMIEDLIHERRSTRSRAEDFIHQSWGGPQMVMGPILSVPCMIGDGTERVRVMTYFLPELLKIEAVATPNLLKRGIFEVPVYDAGLTLEGTFRRPDIRSVISNAREVLWDEALLTVGISDLRANRRAIELEWNQEQHVMSAAVSPVEFLDAQVQTRITGLEQQPADQDLPFNIRLTLAGSGHLRFLPTGRETIADMSSTWPHPSFSGSWLPQSRTVEEDGFQARWSIYALGRGFPQHWRQNAFGIHDLVSGSFGVDFIMPVDIYTQSHRSARYAILFIALTFTAFFLFEVIERMRIHPLQYLMVGLALCLFYLLMLSLSEHIPFIYAYLAASTATTGMIAGYSAVVLKRFGRAMIMVALLTGVYSFLYVLLQLSEMALLLGSVGLFIILGAVMYLTRNIDWYELTPNPTAKIES